jgi:hypothetical protein
MSDSPADGGAAGEVPDHELTRVLHEHGQVLEEQSRTLLATGAASVSVPGALLHARLRIPRRWRKGLLEVTAEDPSSGAALGASAIPLDRPGRRRGSMPLVDELAVRLAAEVAHGPAAEANGPQGGR